MEVVLEVVKTCVPIVVGALIAIIPTMIEKSSDRKHELVEKWGKASSEEQNEKYSNLLKVIRVDLKVDKKLNKDFPKIGLRDISIKSRGNK